MDRCATCAYVYDDVSIDVIPARLAGLGSRFRAAAAGVSPDELRAHPEPGTWSALEYLCHVRDILGVQRERLQLAMVEDHPAFTPMDREGRVERLAYNAQDPAVVLDQLDAAARDLAAAFAALPPAGWERVGTYNWPERADRSMAWVGRHTIHEGEHHLRDLDRLLRG